MNYESAAALFATARDPHAGKPLEGNTRLFRSGDNYAIQLHATDVVTFLPDGRVILDSGGWRTTTTQDRMKYAANIYTDHIYNETGEKIGKGWVISSHVLGHTPPKIQKCRVCHGEGTTSYTSTGEWIYDHSLGRSVHVEYDAPKVTVSTCGRCDGSGRRDYGSRPIHPAYHDGIVLLDGKVVGSFDRRTGKLVAA